jgi:hypothetical protein
LLYLTTVYELNIVYLLRTVNFLRRFAPIYKI